MLCLSKKNIDNNPEIIPISIIYLRGGLGNQMFQYAFFLARQFYTGKKKTTYIDTKLYKQFTIHNGFELERIFDIPCENIISEKLRTKIEQTHISNIHYFIEKDSISWQKIDETNSRISVYNGYWQTEKYFKNIAKKVKECFHFNEEKLNKASQELIKQIRNRKRTVSIHIRRGDYLINYANKYRYGGICTKDYYLSAIKKIKKQIKEPIYFYIFSDDPLWVKENLILSNALIVDWNKGRDSWQDMCLMSACNHHIIANSSFSWWGAWLGNNNEKIVIAPTPWFNQNSTSDIIPDNWFKIQVKKNSFDKKLYLNDVTFIISIRIDSIERKKNLDVLLEYLNSIAYSSIIINETGDSTKYQLNNNYPNTRVIFSDDKNCIYSQGKHINQIICDINSPIIGIWDTDTIIPIEQIDEAIKQIREGNVILSYPYDGHLYSIPLEISECFRIEKDISILKKHMRFNKLKSGICSVSGALFIDRKKILSIGGENEQFYGWGFEDIERAKRIEILGLPFYRAYGPAFHLHHPSSEPLYKNEQTEIHNRKELLKVCQMTKSELNSYIQTEEYSKLKINKASWIK